MEPLADAVAELDLRGRKILLADDDPVSCRMLGGILRGEGFLLTYADSAQAALDTYAQLLPDLVLLDMQPAINGLATCRTLRQQYGAQCAPVIFLTGRSATDEVIDGLGIGGVDYLPKPFNTTEVVARIRAQLQIRAIAEQQAVLVAQLSKANADKNSLLSTAAHDLRNPLASISTLANFLRDGTIGPLTADQRDLVETICTTSHSMLGMVNDLLDVVTIESGELKLHLEKTNCTALIERCVFVANMEAAKKRSVVQFPAPAEAAVLELDPGKMKQVVDNLLSNAVKYSPPGSTIRIELRFEGDQPAAISVYDQGPGIPEKERDKLFKDFGRLSARPTGGEKSTGLGLAICRKIVEAHGATIDAINQPGGGCEFRVTFPKPEPLPFGL